MEEVIAKSKAAKAARQMQKEEDLTATDILDASFASLLQTGALTPLMKEKGARHDRKAAQADRAAQDEGDAEFDRMRRELAFESRAKVTNHKSCTAASLPSLQSCMSGSPSQGLPSHIGYPNDMAGVLLQRVFLIPICA